jgi:hypothetical protein
VLHHQISIYKAGMCVAGDCIATGAPGLPRVVLLSGKGYRAGGSATERVRVEMRQWVRRTLLEQGYLVREVRPTTSYGDVAAEDLVAAWEQDRPRRLTADPG